MLCYMGPIDIMFEIQQVGQFTFHCIIVAGIVDRNAKKVLLKFIILEHLEDEHCYVCTCMWKFRFHKLKQHMTKHLLFLDPVNSNSFFISICKFTTETVTISIAVCGLNYVWLDTLGKCIGISFRRELKHY